MIEIEVLYKRLRERNVPAGRRLKAQVRRCTFSRYVFTEKKRLDKWNRKTHLLKFGIFGLSVKAVRDCKSLLYETFLKEALPLYKTAEKALEEGWQWQLFRVRDYNIIVYYVDFCRKMLNLAESRDLSDHAFSVAEESYLRLINDPDSVELLHTAFRKVFTQSDFEQERLKKYQELLERLVAFLDAETDTPGFAAYMRAFNMAENRRYLNIIDLKNPFAGQLLPEKFYNCSLEVFKAIVALHHRLSEETRVLRAKLNWLEWLDRQSTWKGGEDPTELIAVYEVGKNNWQLDKRDFYAFFFELIRLAVLQLEQVLRKEWELMTSEEKLIRTKIISDDGLSDLYDELAEQFASSDAYYRTNTPSTFPLSEYRGGNLRDTITASKMYKEMMQRIGKILTAFYKLAVGLEELSVNRDYSGMYLLRYMIVRPIQHRGKSVMDLISYQTGLLLKLCRYFLSNELVTELKSAAAAKKELEAKQRMLEHLDSHKVIEDLIAETGAEEAQYGG